MYQVGDVVSYGTEGVCRIAALAERTVGGQARQYYQLEPQRSHSSTVLVPVENAALLDKMRPVMTADQCRALLRALPEALLEWCEDEQQRRAHYRQVFGGGDAFALARLARGLYRRRQALTARGRRLRQADEAAWRDAERLLGDELSFVLGQEPDEVIRLLRAGA